MDDKLRLKPIGVEMKNKYDTMSLEDLIDEAIKYELKEDKYKDVSKDDLIINIIKKKRWCIIYESE